MILPLNEHGGPDSGPPITHDFSSNANPLGAPDEVMRAIQAANRQHYPDPDYRALREGLAQVLGIQPARVLPTAGSSEAIRRLTLAASLRGVRQVWVPQPGYGDYRAAALALGMDVQGYASGEALLSALTGQLGPSLVWLCEPCNPTGQSLPPSFWAALADIRHQGDVILVLDRAYEPLRLLGQDPVPTTLAHQCWQLCSPNKALGLTGVRAGYVIAPVDDVRIDGVSVQALAPSWVLSAEGVAMLQAWHQPGTQAWLARSREMLALWMSAQQTALTRLGWHCLPSVVPFMLARPSQPVNSLRSHGIKLRDATSFGLPGWVRLSAQAPHAQQALFQALAQMEIAR
ncbi:MAG: aminotransferase class I/II-fold pyridoxal phosphate-dependent enzyme [Aquabacterium sp.]|uniref:pyridoxal phosphate-dependent aminotransferase n=1 Tax=Aquabacterium sp. TaxID=1872578 RepID=UPI0027250353|nr:aminotransferase class I/II-fold pyridoxal phosphate-dependent enzyme [Aquabacterium sp.]MDO9006435.1 aminotransferase class I/II-fold pyridoxal phosphate-dependent enzyme [Aquabacterium sp.]